MIRRAESFIVLMLATLPAFCSDNPPPPAAKVTTEFLERHWQRPLPPNGSAPAGFTAAEASLDPAACGTCHPQQLADWKTALHSQAMGPGLLGQLQAMGAEAREDHQSCIQCHTPLNEQAVHLADALASGNPDLPAAENGASYAHGLTCAGCHIRQHQRFGPARADGTTPTPGTPLPHAGWQVETAFSDSRFCSACHQFEPDWPSVNGKPLENTYQEWQASRHAKEGRTCQSCHMPGRRHLWRGIHDREMVRSGLDIRASTTLDHDHVQAKLTIANTGVGHAFPTYVTPRVQVLIGQRDQEGSLLANTLERHLIARDLSLDLSEERGDTRLMPDERRTYAYNQPRDPSATSILFQITVEPDAFYADFYRAVLDDPAYQPGVDALREALRRAEHSSFVLFEEDHKLDKCLAPCSSSQVSGILATPY